ncbi:MAG TPA: trimethylamine methyltransferase family protein [Anaerolineales bacterium]|nr:trimethylamine methyltransferase family protein [Anaerolineales bacterium]
MAIRSLKSNWLHFLSDDQIHQVHEAILQVLWEVGVRIEWTPALEVYHSAGCKVDFEKRVVRIPEDILKRALNTTPASFQLHAIFPENDILVNLEDIYTIAGSSALSVLDLEGKHRPASLQDLSDFTRLIDGLDQAHIMHAMVIPQDIPQVGFDRILFSTIMKNTRKHYYSQGQGGQSVLDQVEMAEIIQGSRKTVESSPVFSFVVCFNSPLVHSAERLQEMMECARFNIPVWLEPSNMMGSTAPITIAGALVEHTANSLAGLVLMQLLHPGHPCVLSIASGGFNMRSGTYVAASPEAILLHCATAQMAHFYGLPFQGGSGLDSCLPDAQAGYERMLQAITMSLAGVNFIHLAFGMIGQLLTSSYEQAVIDNEIFTAAFELTRGIEVNKETLAVDQIKEVGPGGQFLTHPYTLHHYRHYQWQPKLTARLAWDQWQKVYGGKDIRQRANAMAQKILETHHPKSLTQAQETELDRMALAFQQQAIDG